jgi:hypothetical protein
LALSLTAEIVTFILNLLHVVSVDSETVLDPLMESSLESRPLWNNENTLPMDLVQFEFAFVRNIFDTRIEW